MPYRLKSSCQIQQNAERDGRVTPPLFYQLYKKLATHQRHTLQAVLHWYSIHTSMQNVQYTHCIGFSTAGWHSIGIPLAVCMLKLILWGVKCSIHRGLWMNTSTVYTFTIKEIVLWDMFVVVYCFHFGEFRRLCVRFGDMIVFGVFRPLDRYANWLLC